MTRDEIAAAIAAVKEVLDRYERLAHMNPLDARAGLAALEALVHNEDAERYALEEAGDAMSGDGMPFPEDNRLADCPFCDGSGRVTIEHYMKYGGQTKCFVCNGSGQILVLDKLDLDD